MLTIILDLALIGLALFGWVIQLIKLRTQKYIGSFSIYTTAITIIYNIIKIFFWFIVPFSTTIVVQCLLYITINIFVIKQCLQITAKEGNPKRSFSLNNFWKWDTLTQYFLFLFGLVVVLSSIVYISIAFNWPILGEALSYIVVIIQVSLAFPLIQASYKTKSVQGISSGMVAVWTFSDSFKTIYFIMNDQPIPFILTGLIQIFLDMILILQFLIYGKNKTVKPL